MYIHKPLRITKGNNSHRNGPSSLLFIIIICPVDMNVYARFDEIPSITLKDINKTKHYAQTDSVKTVYPLRKSLRARGGGGRGNGGNPNIWLTHLI